MISKHEKRVAQLREALTEGPGKLSIKERSDIVNAINGMDHYLAPEISTWIDKVAFASYKTLDREIADLKNAGYSEQMIFEATSLAAFTAADQILQKGLKLVK